MGSCAFSPTWSIQPPQWLKNLLPLALLAAITFLPFLVRSLAKKPCFLFLFLCDGWYSDPYVVKRDPAGATARCVAEALWLGSHCRLGNLNALESKGEGWEGVGTRDLLNADESCVYGDERTVGHVCAIEVAVCVGDVDSRVERDDDGSLHF